MYGVSTLTHRSLHAVAFKLTLRLLSKVRLYVYVFSRYRAYVLVVAQFPVLPLNYIQIVVSRLVLSFSSNALNLLFVFPSLAALHPCLNRDGIQEILLSCFPAFWYDISKPIIGEKVPKMTFSHCVYKRRYEEVD